MKQSDVRDSDRSQHSGLWFKSFFQKMTSGNSEFFKIFPFRNNIPSNEGNTTSRNSTLLSLMQCTKPELDMPSSRIIKEKNDCAPFNTLCTSDSVNSDSPQVQKPIKNNFESHQPERYSNQNTTFPENSNQTPHVSAETMAYRHFHYTPESYRINCLNHLNAHSTIHENSTLNKSLIAFPTSPIEPNLCNTYCQKIKFPSHVKVLSHSLYNVIAIMSPSSLCIVQFPSMNIIQSIFHPGSPSSSSCWDSPSLPLRLDDAFLPASDKASCLPYQKTEFQDVLLSTSWHRDSLTLAVGTSKALYIFKPSASLLLTVSTFDGINEESFHSNHASYAHHQNHQDSMFYLAFSTCLAWSCSMVLWVNDDLVTKSSNVNFPIKENKDEDHFKDSNHMDSINYFNFSSQLFVWRCEFERCSKFYPEYRPYQEPPLNDVQLSPLYTSPQYFDIKPNEYAFLREKWIEKKPLAEFIKCPETPSFSWSAILGENFKGFNLQSFPQPISNAEPPPNELSTLEVHRVIQHPASRFLAVLYVLLTNSSLPDGSLQFAVTSPIVRIWSVCSSSSAFRLRRRLLSNDNPFSRSLSRHSDDSRPSSTLRLCLKALLKKSRLAVSRCSISSRSRCLPQFLHHKIRRHTSTDTVDALNHSELASCKGIESNSLQDQELKILRQLTSAWDKQLKKKSTIHSKSRIHSSLKPKLSMLFLMSARRHYSENDIYSPHQTTKTNKTSFGNSCDERHRFDGLFDMNLDIKHSMNQYGNFPFLKNPSTTSRDGPYISLSLVHKAPVVDVLWRDTGPVSDGVFVPAVLCSLTVDHCLTVWIESPSSVPLQFDAAIILQLEQNPMINFLSRPNMIKSFYPQPTLFNETVSGVSQYTHQSSKQLLYNSESASYKAGFSQIMTDCAITLCWLTMHHVAYDLFHIDNILRLCKAQAVTSFTDFQMLETNEFDDFSKKESKVWSFSTPYSLRSLTRNWAASPLRSLHDEDEKRQSAPYALCLGPNGHSIACVTEKQADNQSKILHKTSAMNVGFLGSSSDMSNSDLTSRATIPTPPSTRQSVDFLLVAEKFSGCYPSSSGSGLWVYVFRNLFLGSHMKTEPAVKELLNPSHLRFPCHVVSIISAECIPSLGLTNALWADQHDELFGNEVIVKDGIIFPASYIIVLTDSGELYSCVVKPCVSCNISKLNDDDGDDDDDDNPFFKVAYRITVKNVCRSFPLVSEPSWHIRPFLNIKPPIKEPLAASSLSCKHTYWMCVEEHPFNSFISLALSNLGCLFVGVISPLDCCQDEPKPPYSSLHQTATYCFSNDKSGESSDSFLPSDLVFQETKMNYTSLHDFHFSPKANENGYCPYFVDYREPLGTITALDSLASQWLDNKLVLKNPFGSKFHLPPIRFVVWLPVFGVPSVALCITEPFGHLLALEIVSKFSGQLSSVRALPILGDLNQYLKAVLEISVIPPPGDSQITRDDAELDCKASVAFLQAAPQTENICLLLLRIRSRTCTNQQSNALEPFEENVVLLRCHRHNRQDTSEISNSQQNISSTATLSDASLAFEILFEKNLDFPRLCARASHSFGVTDPYSNLTENPCGDQVWEPQLCFSGSCVSTAHFATGLLAMFPPLELQLLSNTDVPSDTLFISIHYFEENLLTRFALASVHLPDVLNGSQSIATDIFPYQVVVGLSINEDYLAAMTCTGCILLYSLSDTSPAQQHPESFASILFASNHSTGAKGHNEERIKESDFFYSSCFPVFLPSSFIDLRTSLTKEYELLMNNRLYLFQSKAGFSFQNSISQNPTSYSNRVLLPQCLGDPAYLSFRYTKGNGLLLLVVLCLKEDTLSEESAEACCTKHTFPHCIPYVFCKSSDFNKDLWLECSALYSKKIATALKCYQDSPDGSRRDKWFISYVSWNGDYSQLLLGFSSFDSVVWRSALYSPLRLALPVSYLQQACTISASRPLYHPVVLSSHLRTSACTCYLRIILNKLFCDLCHWREHCGETHFSPILDFSLPFLNALFEQDHADDSPSQTVISQDTSFGLTTCTRNLSSPAHSCNHSQEYSKITQSQLERLIYFIDLQHKENLLWLDTHGLLLPHLSLLETIQLHGLLQFVSFLFAPLSTLDKLKGKSFTQCERRSHVELVELAEQFKTENLIDPNKEFSNIIDLPSSYFLLGYGIAISVDNSLQNAIQLSKRLEMPIFENIFADVCKPLDDHNIEAHETALYHTTRLLSECANVVSQNQITDGSKSLGVTTFDVAWAVQCLDTQALLQRTIDITSRLRLMEQGSPVIHGGEKNVVTWPFLQQAGAGIWLSHPETVWNLACEIIPRNTFALQPLQERNPDDIAMWYIVTNRVSVLQGLYRIKKNIKVMEFLSNDFNEPRWISAAIKNAYTLLKQKRHMLATGFFLLAHAYQEALDVCCGQLNDPQLALFLVKVLMFRFRMNQEESDFLQSIFYRLIYDRLLTCAINSDDEWLQSSLFWISHAYLDALICLVPRYIRPSPVSNDMNQHKYNLRRLYYTSFMYSKNNIGYYCKQWISCSSATKSSCSIPPLHYIAQSYTKYIYRSYLLSTVNVRQRLSHFCNGDESHTFDQSFTNKFSSTGEKFSARACNLVNIMTTDGNLLVTSSDLCHIIATHQNLVNRLEQNDTFFDMLWQLRFPAGCFSVKRQKKMHWIQVTALLRSFYDPAFLLHKESWDHLCDSFTQLLYHYELRIQESFILLSPFASWCGSHGPEHFIYWLSKLCRHTEEKKQIKNAHLKNNFVDQFQYIDISGDLGTASRGPTYISPEMHHALNECLKRTPRFSLISDFDNTIYAERLKPYVFYGWADSLFYLCYPFFRIHTVSGYLTLKTFPLHNVSNHYEFLRAASLVALGWLRVGCAIGHVDQTTQLFAHLTISLSLAGCLILLIEKQRRLQNFYVMAKPHDIYDKTPNKHDTSKCIPLINESAWEKLEHLTTCFKAFTILLSLGKWNEKNFDAMHQISGTLFSLLLFTNFSEKNSHHNSTEYDKAETFCEPHEFNHFRRVRLWNQLQETIYSALYDETLLILRKSLLNAQNLFQFSPSSSIALRKSFIRSGRFNLITVDEAPQNHKNLFNPLTTQPSSTISYVISRDTLYCLIDSFQSVVEYFEEVFHFEYRPSILTQLILFASLDFPYFISHMWFSTSHGAHNPVSDTSSNLTKPVTGQPTTTASSPCMENQGDASWFTLFEETALCSKTSVLSFFRVWCMLSCRLRLELLLTRCTIQHLPQIFTTLLCDSSLNSFPRCIPLFRETCQTLSVDHTQPLHFTYCVPTLSGNTLSLCNGVPIGLCGAFDSHRSGAGLGWLLTSSGKNVTEFNVSQAIFCQHLRMSPLDFSHLGCQNLQIPKQSLNSKSWRLLAYYRSLNKTALEDGDLAEKQKELDSPKVKNQGDQPNFLKFLFYEDLISQCVDELFSCRTWLYPKHHIRSPFSLPPKQDMSTAEEPHHNKKETHTATQPSLVLKDSVSQFEHSHDTENKHDRLTRLPSTMKETPYTQGLTHFKLKHPMFGHLSEYRHDHRSPFIRRLAASLRQSLYKEKLIQTNPPENASLCTQPVLVCTEMFLRGLWSPCELIVDRASWSSLQPLQTISIPFLSRGLASFLVPNEKNALLSLSSQPSVKHTSSFSREDHTDENSSNASYLWIQYIRRLYFKRTYHILKTLQTILIQPDKCDNFIRKVYNHSHISLLVSHPMLPLAAGALVISLKDSIAHVAHEAIPILGIWTFQSSQLLGVLTLSTVSPRFYTAPTLDLNNNPHCSVECTDFSEKANAPADAKQRPHTVFPPWLSKHRYFRKPLKSDHSPIYQETGHVISLQWSTCGRFLVAGHAKGWVTIWSLFDSKILNSTALNATHECLNTNTFYGFSQLSLASSGAFQQGGRPVGFKLHLTSCRHVALVTDETQKSMLLITSGRGLDVSIYLKYFSTTSKKDSSEKISPILNTVDQTFLCVWDLSIQNTKKDFHYQWILQLKTINTDMAHSDKTTNFAVWYTRQVLLYGTRRGSVHYLNLRTMQHSSHSIIRLPTNGQYLPENLKDNETMFHRHDEFQSKGILKLFLLEESQRLVTCHNDGTIRLWDLSPFCTPYFSRTGTLSLKKSEKATCFESNTYEQSTVSTPFYVSLQKTFHPYQKHEMARLFALGFKPSTVFHMTSSMVSHTLVDASLIGKHHLLTLSDDGTVVLTRLS